MPNIGRKSSRELESMARAGQIVADTLVMLRQSLRPGISTRELNALAEQYMRRRGAITSYREVKFNGVVCVSINEEVVHGIPGARTVRAGDIVSLDIAAIHGGFHADAAITVPVGIVSSKARRLLTVTEQALALGISLATPGRHLFDISAAVQDYVEGEGFSVVRNLSGHGIGRSMWEEPTVPNYRQDSRGPLLRAGNVFTIEPMVNAGREDVVLLPDNWTIMTEDMQLSAHFEHTVAVTEHGPRILTRTSDARELWATERPHLRVAHALHG